MKKAKSFTHQVILKPYCFMKQLHQRVMKPHQVITKPYQVMTQLCQVNTKSYGEISKYHLKKNYYSILSYINNHYVMSKQ